MHSNIKRVLKSRDRLSNATNKNLINTMVRLWIEWDKKIHALNYLYYRYFTNEFELFCLKTKYSEEDDEDEYKCVNCVNCVNHAKGDEK